jgi:uncharacterized protein YbjQ (UPF0145 family)
MSIQTLLQVNAEVKNNYYMSVGGQSQLSINPAFVTSALDFPGYTIVRSLGIGRGITVRTRNCCSAIAFACSALCGGRSVGFTYLCEQAREEAMQLLIRQAQTMGGNAIIAFRFEANNVMDGMTEVLAYGTVVEIKAN